MKKIFSHLGLAAALLSLAACGNESDAPATPEASMPLRQITVAVAEPASRTTIEYDGADVSHLVWSEGDQVAYITDFAGDVCRTAAVSNNSFTASVPEGATDANRLIVVYPADGLAGKSLAEFELATSNPATVNPTADFDGARLPMLSVSAVPDGSRAYADFTVPASVIRLSIASLGHEEETLQSVTLSANEALTATYRLGSDGMVATPGEKAISMNIETDYPENATLAKIEEDKGFIYFVVNRGQYTGLTLTVTTDGGTYSFPDGKIDVAKEGRTLYRLNIALSEPDEPEVPAGYVRVTSADQITTGDKVSYLIVCEAENALFAEFNSGNYHPFVPTTIVDGTIDPTLPEATKCKFTLIPGSGEFEGRYQLYNTGIRNSEYYVGAMANFSSTPAKVAFVKPGSAAVSRCFWKIEFDGEGNVRLMAFPHTYDNATNTGTVHLAYYPSIKAFANCAADGDASKETPLQLYKYVAQ